MTQAARKFLIPGGGSGIGPALATQLIADASAAGLPVLSPEAFARTVVAELAGDSDEIAIGMAAAARAQGERLFAVINP